MGECFKPFKRKQWRQEWLEKLKAENPERYRKFMEKNPNWDKREDARDHPRRNHPRAAPARRAPRAAPQPAGNGR